MRAPLLLLRPRGRLASLMAEAVCDWGYFQGSGAVRSGSDRLCDIRARAFERGIPSVALVLPGEDVLVLDVCFPPGAQSRWAKAAPYLVEDYLLEEVESVHVALAAVGGGDVRRVAVIHAQCLSRAVELLSLHGVPADSAWVDHELLGAGRDTTSAFRDGERLLLCSPDAPGFTGSPGAASRWMDMHGHPASTSRTDVSRAAFFSELHGPVGGDAVINLLQGNFEPASAQMLRRRARWRFWQALFFPPMLVTLVAVVLGLWHERQAAALNTESRAMLAERDPVLARAPSLARALDAQGRQSMQEPQARTRDFATLLGALGTALATRAPESRPRILGLRYQGSHGLLEVMLAADSVGVLDALRIAMDDHGAPARLVSASRAGERFEGRLRIGHERP